MDVGKSLNPAIDVGQIEGAFTQGYGLLTLEQHRYSPQGFLYTRGPGMYKIPGFSDIPVEMNVTLLKGAANPKAVYASKVLVLGFKCVFPNLKLLILKEDAKNAVKVFVYSSNCVHVLRMCTYMSCTCLFLCHRRSVSRRCAWPPPSSTPSRLPSPPLAPTPATAATSRSTAPPPQSASAWRASTSSPSRCVHIHFCACVCHLYFCTCRWDTSMRGSRELRNACINRLVMLQFNCVCSSRSLSLGRSSPGSLSSSRGSSSSGRGSSSSRKPLLDLSRETDWQLTQ